MQYFSYIVAWTNFILNTFKTLRNKTLFFNLANQFVCFNLFCILTTGCWWGFPRSKRNELLSVSPGGGFEIPLDEGCQIITQKTWPLIIVSNVFVDFDTLQKPKFFVTIQISILFQWRSKFVVPSFPHFYIVFIYHWTCSRHEYVYVIWMWIDWYRKYQPVEPENEVWWRVSEANSYSVEQADIFQNQSYSDDMFIIIKSNINTDTSIFVCSREKSHDSKYTKYASPKHSS